MLNSKPYKHSWAKHFSPFSRAMVNRSNLVPWDAFSFPNLLFYAHSNCTCAWEVSVYLVIRPWEKTLKNQSLDAAHWHTEVTQCRAGSIPADMFPWLMFKSELNKKSLHIVLWILKSNREETEPFKHYW